MNRMAKFSVAFLFFWLAPFAPFLMLGISFEPTLVAELFGSTLFVSAIAYGVAAILTKKGTPTSFRLFCLIMVLYLSISLYKYLLIAAH